MGACVRFRIWGAHARARARYTRCSERGSRVARCVVHGGERTAGGGRGLIWTAVVWLRLARLCPCRVRWCRGDWQR